jgi:hypothetical protein
LVTTTLDDERTPPMKSPFPGMDPYLEALAYQRGRYARTIDYSRLLDLPLQPEDKAWAEQIVAPAIGRTTS